MISVSRKGSHLSFPEQHFGNNTVTGRLYSPLEVWLFRHNKKYDVSQLDLQECTAVTIVTCKTVRGIHTRFPLPSVFAQSWKNIFKKTSESTLFHNVIRTRHSPKKKSVCKRLKTWEIFALVYLIFWKIEIPTLNVENIILKLKDYKTKSNWSNCMFPTTLK